MGLAVWLEGRAVGKHRLHLSRFSPEFKNSFLLFQGGWAFSPRLCHCRPSTPSSMETLPAPRSLAGAPSPNL